MDKLRKPFLVAAILCCVAILALEVGMGSAPQIRGLLKLDKGGPPGIAIAALALIDFQLLFATILYGLGAILPHPLVGRIQGIASLIVAIVLLLASIVTIFVAIALILLMIALIGSFFGIIVYLILFGDFDRGTASAVLFVLLILKLAAGACLVLAHQRFLQNKGLILLVLTSLLANVIVSFLQGLVPIILVSITDAIAAIIVAILGLIWAIGLLIGSIISIIRILRPEQHHLPSQGVAPRVAVPVPRAGERSGGPIPSASRLAPTSAVSPTG